MCFSLFFLSLSFCLAVSASVATLLLSACLSVCVSHYLFLLPSLALSFQIKEENDVGDGYDKRPAFFTFSLNDAVCKHDLGDSAVEASLAVMVISLLLCVLVSVGHGLFVSAEDIANESCWGLAGCDTEVICACFRTCFIC